MSNTLFILNEAPYGSERSYNALRLAGALAKRDDEQIRVFLMGDAASCAKGGQKVPDGYYKIENMLRAVLNRDGEIAVCGTCMDARGLSADDLLSGTRRSSLAELTDWLQWADRDLVF